MITRAFLLALAMIESGNQDIPGDGGLAQGPLQMHSISVAEANRIIMLKGLPLLFQDSDRHELVASMIMTKIIMTHWAKHWLKKGHKMTNADFVAFHRWGPSQWKPNKTGSTKIDFDRSSKLKTILGDV